MGRYALTLKENDIEASHGLGDDVEKMKYQCLRWCAYKPETRKAFLYDREHQEIIYSVALRDQEIQEEIEKAIQTDLFFC